MNKYLGGDYGILIGVGGVIAAIWVGHRLKSGMDQAQSVREAPEATLAPPAAAPAGLPGSQGRDQPESELEQDGVRAKTPS